MGLFDRKQAQSNLLLNSLDAIRGEGYIGYVKGVFNVEGGNAAIATEYLEPCDSCSLDDSVTTSDCEKCDRSPEVFARFQAGRGDGVYTVLQICNSDDFTDSIGALIIMNQELSSRLIEMIYNGGTPFSDLDFRNSLNEDLMGYKISDMTANFLPGNFECIEDKSVLNAQVWIGDSSFSYCSHDSGEYSYVNFDVKPGSYSLYLSQSKPEEFDAALARSMRINMSIPTERSFALLLQKDLETRMKLSPEAIPAIEVEEGRNILDTYALGSLSDTVMMHMNNMGFECVKNNMHITNPSKYSDLNFGTDVQFDFLTWLVASVELGGEDEFSYMISEFQSFDFSPDDVQQIIKTAAIYRRLDMSNLSEKLL